MANLEDAYSREKLDHERETRFNRDIQIHEMELMDKISRIKTIMVCAYCLAIIIPSYHNSLILSIISLIGSRAFCYRAAGRRRVYI